MRYPFWYRKNYNTLIIIIIKNNLKKRGEVRNIIEYNPIPDAPFEKASGNKIDIFAKTVREKGIMVTVRRSRGKDIDAACGQLANQE